LIAPRPKGRGFLQKIHSKKGGIKVNELITDNSLTKIAISLIKKAMPLEYTVFKVIISKLFNNILYNYFNHGRESFTTLERFFKKLLRELNQTLPDLNIFYIPKTQFAESLYAPLINNKDVAHQQFIEPVQKDDNIGIIMNMIATRDNTPIHNLLQTPVSSEYISNFIEDHLPFFEDVEYIRQTAEDASISSAIYILFMSTPLETLHTLSKKDLSKQSCAVTSINYLTIPFIEDVVTYMHHYKYVYVLSNDIEWNDYLPIHKLNVPTYTDFFCYDQIKQYIAKWIEFAKREYRNVFDKISDGNVAELIQFVYDYEPANIYVYSSKVELPDILKNLIDRHKEIKDVVLEILYESYIDYINYNVLDEDEQDDYFDDFFANDINDADCADYIIDKLFENDLIYHVDLHSFDDLEYQAFNYIRYELDYDYVPNMLADLRAKDLIALAFLLGESTKPNGFKTYIDDQIAEYIDATKQKPLLCNI
jgi:hypothetical protein